MLRLDTSICTQTDRWSSQPLMRLNVTGELAQNYLQISLQTTSHTPLSKRNFLTLTKKHTVTSKCNRRNFAINILEGMSTGTNLLNTSLLHHGQSRAATPTPSRPTSSHASANSMDGALQKALQEYVQKLSDDDRAAFQSAPNIMERLQEMQSNGETLLSSSLTTRVEKVLQFFKNFMSSLSVFGQQSPEISLVVGGVNCILTVGTSTYLHIIHLNLG